MLGNLNSKEDIVEFQIKKNVIGLYKSFLIILEDLGIQHDRNFNKLLDALPDDRSLIEQADYFDDELMSHIRKKVLDNGNDCLRNILEIIEKGKGNNNE